MRLQFHVLYFFLLCALVQLFCKCSIKELDRYFDDHSYSADKRSTDSDFGLFRTHLGTRRVINGCYEFLEDVVIPRADKIVINERYDLRMVALSDVVRHRRNNRAEDYLPNFSEWDKVQERYHRIIVHKQVWSDWLDVVCSPDKQLYITWEELNEDTPYVIDKISKFLEFPLNFSGEWDATDYTSIPDFKERINALKGVYGIR